MLSMRKKRKRKITYDGQVPYHQAKRLRRKLNAMDAKIKFKDEGYDVWWHWLVAWFVQFFFWVARQLKDDFEATFQDYITTLGKYIYFPTREGYDIRDFDDWVTVWHELKHVRDSRNWPILYEISYGILPLPMFWTMRSYWEYRGYGTELWAMYQLTGTLSGYYYDYEREGMAGEFSGWNYGKMDPGKEDSIEKLEQISEEIEAGNISFEDMSSLPWLKFALT